MAADLRTQGHVCVTELVEHCINTTRDHYEPLGVKDWLFYHDALQQMTDERCRIWMQEKGYFDRWITPLFGLNDSVYGKGRDGKWTYSTRYKKRPVGDSPELVALDCHLNKDVRDCAVFHSALTSELPTGDERKFDLTTYKKYRDALVRLLSSHHSCSCCARANCNCGCLPPKRIFEDVVRSFGESLLQVQRAKGVVIQGLGDRNGDRKLAATFDLVGERRGGSRPSHKQRVKEIKEAGLEGIWVHPDAYNEWQELAGE